MKFVLQHEITLQIEQKNCIIYNKIINITFDYTVIRM